MTPSTMQGKREALSPTLQLAFQFHAQGKLDEAELACRAALNEQPGCVEALH
jgi:hypothetical protein